MVINHDFLFDNLLLFWLVVQFQLLGGQQPRDNEDSIRGA